MKARGRPLHFLGRVLGGWVLFRVAWLWPTIQTPADLIHAIVPPVAAATAPRPLVSVDVPAATRLATHTAHASASAEDATPKPPPAPDAADDQSLAIAAAALVRYGDPIVVDTLDDTVSAPPPGVVPPLQSRLTGSSWLLARGGSASAGLLGGSQLGGSQGGVRLSYALGEARRVAITARFATPLSNRGDREVSLGIAWQPTRLPVQLIAEQRFALDRGGSGPVVGAIGGFGPAAVAGRLTLEGYGQAGVIRRHGTQGFADGSLRLAAPLHEARGLRVDLGAGAWGGAQRNASRLDVGPSLAATVKRGERAVRVALEWRQRIAGNARPGSGPALAVGTDF